MYQSKYGDHDKKNSYSERIKFEFEKKENFES